MWFDSYQDETIVFILGVDLPVGIHGHEIVASKDNKVLYTIGNYYGNYNNKDIFKFTCTNNITNCSWTKISTELQYQNYFVQFGSYVAVAMTIPNSLANKLCNWSNNYVWNYPPIKVLFLIKASYDYFQYWFKSAYSNQIKCNPLLVLW